MVLWQAHLESLFKGLRLIEQAHSRALGSSWTSLEFSQSQVAGRSLLSLRLTDISRLTILVNAWQKARWM